MADAGATETTHTGSPAAGAARSESRGEVKHMRKLPLRVARDEDAQTMAEYSVVLGVITVGVLLSFGFLANAIESKLGAAVKIVTAAKPFG